MKITAHKIATWLKAVTCTTLLAITTAGCKKDTPSAPAREVDGSTLKFVLNDNFTFGVVYGALTQNNLQDSLAKPGPYTFLAPNNNAYVPMNITVPLSSYSFGSYDALRLKNELQYYILDGAIAFNAIPLVENNPYKTHTGGNIYVTRYLDGTDTVTTVNGVKLVNMDNPASNGLIQVLSLTMNPEVYFDALSYLHSDTTLTLFSAALQRSGLDQSLLKGSDAYTLLAPSNTAFQQSAALGLDMDISSIDAILQADPAKLAAFLKYHIIKGRYFDGDLFRYIQANPAGIPTLQGGNVIIGGTPDVYKGITFLGSGNNGTPAAIALPYPYNLIVHNENIPCGNAVVHIIDRVLIP